MPDVAFERATRTQGQEIGKVFIGGEEAEFIFGRGTQLFPNLPVPIWGMLDTRTLLDADERWFEFGFRINTELSGNAAAGWTDAGNYLRIEPEWSLDLATWHAGKFIPAPVPVINNGDGTWSYWSRCIHPTDSAVKSGQLQASSGDGYGGFQALGGINGDARNNPFTALVILGVVRNLGGFPYTMPADAARMQTDLAAIFPGATVEASTNVDWRIIIPNITTSAFNQANKVSWPGYLVPDFFGDLTNTIDGGFLAGNFVNALGVLIYQKGFARLKITGGSRYDPFLP
jgi:hypothetical protein